MRSTVARMATPQRGVAAHNAIDTGIGSLPLLRSENESGKSTTPAPVHRRVIGGDFVSKCPDAQRQLSQYVVDHGLLGHPPLWFTETDLRSTKPWLSLDRVPHAVLCVARPRELELVHISAVAHRDRTTLLTDLPPPSLDVSIGDRCAKATYLELQYDSEGDPRRLRWCPPMNRKAFYSKCVASVDEGFSDPHANTVARCLERECAQPACWIHVAAAQHMQLSIDAKTINAANHCITRVRFVVNRGAFHKLFHCSLVPKN